MNTRDTKLIALQFNEYINKQDIKGLTSLMTDDHTFIDRAGAVDKGKESMTKGWIEFSRAFLTIEILSTELNHVMTWSFWSGMLIGQRSINMVLLYGQQG